ADFEKARRARKRTRAEIERDREDAVAHHYAVARNCRANLSAAHRRVKELELKVIRARGRSAPAGQAALIGEGRGLRKRRVETAEQTQPDKQEQGSRELLLWYALHSFCLLMRYQ